jgi:DNA-binding NarL/FixJ family response regulator
MGRARILIADDHTLIVDAFRKLLEPELEVVGGAANGHALLEQAPKLKPDLVIVDLNMPLLNGLDAGRELKRMIPHTKIIVLTMSEDFEVAADALRHWANGYLLKKSAGSELVKAIHEVLKGKSYVTPRLAQHLLDEFIRDPRPHVNKPLTLRQREVLQLLAEGRTMKEVAAVLNLTARTVAFHKYRIMEEFGLKNNADLVRFAIKEHLITSE